MNDTVRRLGEIAEKLPPDQQEVLLEIAVGLLRPSRFYDLMAADQRRELDAAIAEADRNEGISPADVEARLGRIDSHRKA
jgi:hypothetical protein